MPTTWRAEAERTLRLELSRYADRLARVAVAVTPPATVRLSVALDSGERLDLEHQGDAGDDALRQLARRASRLVGHSVRSSNLRMNQ